MATHSDFDAILRDSVRRGVLTEHQYSDISRQMQESLAGRSSLPLNPGEPLSTNTFPPFRDAPSSVLANESATNAIPADSQLDMLSPVGIFDLPQNPINPLVADVQNQDHVPGLPRSDLTVPIFPPNQPSTGDEILNIASYGSCADGLSAQMFSQPVLAESLTSFLPQTQSMSSISTPGANFSQAMFLDVSGFGSTMNLAFPNTFTCTQLPLGKTWDGRPEGPHWSAPERMSFFMDGPTDPPSAGFFPVTNHEKTVFDGSEELVGNGSMGIFSLPAQDQTNAPDLKGVNQYNICHDLPSTNAQEARIPNSCSLSPETISFPQNPLARRPRENQLTTKSLSKSGPISSRKRTKKRRAIEDMQASRSIRRDEGQCLFCKFLKEKCSPNTPCPLCVKYAGSELAARHICLRGLVILRSKLSNVYSEELFLLRAQRYSEYAKEYRNVFTKSQPVLMGYTCQHGMKTWVDLPIEVDWMYYEAPEVCQDRGEHSESTVRTLIVGLSSEDITSVCIANRASRKEFLLEDVAYTPEQLEMLMDRFIAAYLECKSNSTMHDLFSRLLMAVLGLEMLVNEVCPHCPQAGAGNIARDDDHSWFNAQIIGLETNESIEAEKETLFELDRILKSGNQSYLTKNHVLLGLICRRLSLLYRDRMELYLFESNLELAQKARYGYEMLCAAYVSIYRKSRSPFSSEWSLKEHEHEFGGNPKLMAMFEQIVEAEKKTLQDLDEEIDAFLLKSIRRAQMKERGVKSFDF